MVSPPPKWSYKPNPTRKMVQLNELFGGYLSTGEHTDKHIFSVLSSRDSEHFNIILTKANRMCNILNNLQSQSLKINVPMLDFVIGNRSSLEKAGILMDRRLPHVKVSDANSWLRFCYYNSEIAKTTYSTLSKMESEFSRRVQQARF